MTLSDRERFILHAGTLTSAKLDGSLKMTIQEALNIVLKNRCRTLSKNQHILNELKEDIDEEVLQSETFYKEFFHGGE